jgi:hypothetical protein
MTLPLKITKYVHFRSMKRGRKELREGLDRFLSFYSPNHSMHECRCQNDDDSNRGRIV